MASSLAHELNQPLTAVAGFMAAGVRFLADPTAENVAMAREALKGAGEQSVRAGRIIGRLREFVAKGESEKRSESIVKLVEEASALALVGAKERGIRVQYRIDRGIERVLVDKVQIQQVILNLVRNGIEAMEGSPVRELTVATHAEADGRTVRVSVADTGGGLPAEIAERLFQPFVTTKAQGWGRPVDLPIHRRGPWRANPLGPEPWRRLDLQLHGQRSAAGRRRRRRAAEAMTGEIERTVHVVDDDQGCATACRCCCDRPGSRWRPIPPARPSWRARPTCGRDACCSTSACPR